jgi:hypothetical protein
VKRPFLLAALLAVAPTTVLAALDVPVASRVVTFLQPAPSGAVPAVIVWEPGNAASEADALAIEDSIGAGLAVGRGTLHARRVPVSNLAGLAGARIAFVTAGLHQQQQVADAASHGGIVTITSDLSCVQAGHCVVGVTGGPRPQIVVSRAAAKATGARFGTAFLMLVKEI